MNLNAHFDSKNMELEYKSTHILLDLLDKLLEFSVINNL